MKKNLFIPDRIFENIYAITPDYLIGENIRFVLSDIDNTLVTYNDDEPTKEVLEWFSALDSAGIKTAFISNNNEERVRVFNKDLNYPACSRSSKPSRKSVRKLMGEMGAEKENTCVLGDQIFTDVLCAKRSGLRALFVPSIGPQKNLFGRIKKYFEKRFIAKYYEMNKE